MPDDDMLSEDTEELSPGAIEAIRQARADGVSLFLDRDGGPDGRVKMIHWRPGRRNALAEIIAEEVRAPMKLNLNGRPFIILPYSDKMWEELL